MKIERVIGLDAAIAGEVIWKSADSTREQLNTRLHEATALMSDVILEQLVGLAEELVSVIGLVESSNVSGGVK